MKFVYRGYDKIGQPASGNIEAATADVARTQLRAQGIFAGTLQPAGLAGAVAGGANETRGGGWLGAGGRLRDLAHFARQASVLVSTGTTVSDALSVIEAQLAPGRWRDVVGDLRRRVEEGAQLSEAMAANPRYFDSVCRSLVAAGESRGTLADMLQRLSALTRQHLKTRAAVIGALIYPVLLIHVALFVMLGLMLFVMPRFEEMFKNLGAELPPTTRMLMSTGDFIRAQWPWLLAGAAMGFGAIVVWLRSESGKAAIQVLAVRTPVIGPVARALITARLARILGVLLDGKVTLVDALALTRLAAGNLLYTRLMARAEDAVTRGEPVSAAFADRSLIHPSMHEAMRSGERSGQVGAVLLHLAEFLDEDNDSTLKTLASVIEPLILVVLGMVVAAVALSMFLPLFDLAGAGGGMTPGAASGGVP